MGNNSSNKKSISLRITNEIHSKVMIYANANNLTLTKAIEDLVEEGLRAKNEPVATKTDIERLVAETKRVQEQQEKIQQQQETTKLALVQAIQNQPVEIQKLEPPKKKWYEFFKREN